MLALLCPGGEGQVEGGENKAFMLLLSNSPSHMTVKTEVLSSPSQPNEWINEDRKK